jgi:hypothetical protein
MSYIFFVWYYAPENNAVMLNTDVDVEQEKPHNEVYNTFSSFFSFFSEFHYMNNSLP